MSIRQEAERAASGPQPGGLGAEQACEAALEAAQSDELGVFWALDADRARGNARAVDRARARDDDAGPLAGVTVAVKDCLDVAGLPTTCGVADPEASVAESDSAAVAALRTAGAIILGKAAMHQLAWGMSGQAPGFPPCRNPSDPERMPGGSSSGSAVAVATGIVRVALGTDAGGSVRVPAAWCGVVGFKPTRGAVPLAGCAPMAASLDTVGVFARTVSDAARVFGVLAGRRVEAASPRSALRVGVPERLFEGDPDVLAVCRDALARWEGAGARLEPVELEWPRRRLGLVYASEFAAAWREAVARRPQLFGDDVKAGIESGREVAAVDYLLATAELRALDEAGRAAFDAVDVIASPTVPSTPPLLCAPDPVTVAGRNTRPFNGLGWPALSLPCGTVRGLPVGLQLAAAPGGDAELLALAAALEERLRD